MRMHVGQVWCKVTEGRGENRCVASGTAAASLDGT